jgi:ferredoxin
MNPKFETAPMLFIHPEECIDCGACVPACPVTAIYDSPDATPANQKDQIEANAIFRAGDAEACGEGRGGRRRPRCHSLRAAQYSPKPSERPLTSRRLAAFGFALRRALPEPLGGESVLPLLAPSPGSLVATGTHVASLVVMTKLTRMVPWVGARPSRSRPRFHDAPQRGLRGALDAALDVTPVLGGAKNDRRENTRARLHP